MIKDRYNKYLKVPYRFYYYQRSVRDHIKYSMGIDMVQYGDDFLELMDRLRHYV